MDSYAIDRWAPRVLATSSPSLGWQHEELERKRRSRKLDGDRALIVCRCMGSAHWSTGGRPRFNAQSGDQSGQQSRGATERISCRCIQLAVGRRLAFGRRARERKYCSRASVRMRLSAPRERRDIVARAHKASRRASQGAPISARFSLGAARGRAASSEPPPTSWIRCGRWWWRRRRPGSAGIRRLIVMNARPADHLIESPHTIHQQFCAEFSINLASTTLLADTAS